MSGERATPLKNPPSERVNNNTNVTKNLVNHAAVDGFGRSGRESREGGRRVSVAEAILKCPHCNHLVKIVYAYPNVPQFTRCVSCNELQPTDGYYVVMYGRGLPPVERSLQS